MMANSEIGIESTLSRRVLAWWDLDVRIGAFRKRKMTARPLRELERVLGHRLHVEGWWRHRKMLEGVWKFEAFNYLETADPSVGAYSTLKQLSQLSGWLGMSWQGYNRAATALTDDPDRATICAFYWNPPDQYGMPRYQSSGVLLQLDDPNRKAVYRRDNRPARPLVRLTATPRLLADYVVEFTVHITCSDKRDLLGKHWPRMQESIWPGGVSHFDVDSRTHAGKPNVVRVKQTLRNVREHEAVVYCLCYAPSFRVKLDSAAPFRFIGERQLNRDHSDGIVAFVMTCASG